MKKKHYKIDENVAVYDNKREVCFYWYEEARGTTLSGLGAHLFRSLQKHVQDSPFSLEDLSGIDPSIGQETWEEVIEALKGKKILIKEDISPSQPTMDKLKTMRIALSGSSRLISGVLNMLIDFGFIYFIIEDETGNNDFSYPPYVKIVRTKNLTNEDILSCDLLLYLDDMLHIQRHRSFNVHSIDHDIRFLSLRLFGSTFELGPLVIPGESACFDCYWQRLQAGSASPPSWFIDMERNNPYVPKSPLGDSLYAIASQFTALECWRSATKNMVPLTLGHIFCQDIKTGQIRFPAVFEVPGCHSCAMMGVTQK